MKYLVLIRYLGTDFCGFQAQPDRRTVQGELTRAAAECFGGPCAVTGCSRTDSGVHAENFCATVEPLFTGAPVIPPDRLPRAIAQYLPRDLSLFFAKEAPPDFHPRYGILEKEYRYDICNTPLRDPFLAARTWHYPRKITDRALDEMNRAAAAFVGKQDFAALMAAGSTVTDTVRTISRCECKREGDIISVYVRGDGFLYNMVRIIVGTLTAVSAGKLTPEQIPAILASGDRTLAGMTAPPEGLHLATLFYPEGVLSK
jgi:tRNA pseudouridine38-40 synthase